MCVQKRLRRAEKSAWLSPAAARSVTQRNSSIAHPPSRLSSRPAASGKEVTTLEGLPARWAKQKGLSPADAEKTLHPVQQAWIEEQTPLCGFCQNGMMIKAVEWLERVASPTITEIKEAFTTSGPSPHLCRCGSYTAIIEAVERAATVMAKGR